MAISHRDKVRAASQGVDMQDERRLVAVSLFACVRRAKKNDAAYAENCLMNLSGCAQIRGLEYPSRAARRQPCSSIVVA
eukprot:6190809-Pleurochrysis_carterae.AAC.1